MYSGECGQIHALTRMHLLVSVYPTPLFNPSPRPSTYTNHSSTMLNVFVDFNNTQFNTLPVVYGATCTLDERAQRTRLFVPRSRREQVRLSSAQFHTAA
jgi:hypothetical protein